MPIKTATIFVDDQDAGVKYLCPSLKQKVAGTYYKDTWTSPQNETCGTGWFQYSFYGTGVHVAASFAKPSNFSVKIDDGDLIPQSGSGSYDSPQLSDGLHTITYAMGSLKSMPALDYLAITAGRSTPMVGKSVTVDDSDSSVVFSGSWSDSSPYPASFDYTPTLYNKTMHWTSKVGDTMDFQFEGTSVAVYGMVAYNSTSPRNITANYTIDGISQTLTITNKTLAYLPMVELFHADVQDGNHTVVFSITDIQGQRALGIDFVSYNASFPSISPLQTSGNRSSSVPSWAPKVGIAIAAIAGFIFLLVVFLIFWRRFRKDRHQGKAYAQTP